MNSFLTDLPGLSALSELQFLRPLWFLALAPLPWLLWRLRRHDPGVSAWRGLVDAHLLSHLLVGTEARVRRLPLALLACGWLLGVTALAGPVWERLPQPLFQAQAQRVIILDLSPDMDAQDLSPSRLGRARFEILDLLAAAAEGQTALLAYGAEPFLVSPLTGDAATIAAQVPDLATALLPVKGAKRTDLALAEAGELLKQAGSLSGDIILITADPERPEAVQSMATKLRDQGYRTSVLGLGTDQGAPVPLAGGGFQSDDRGAIRLSRLQPEQLRAIAAAGGGRYVPLATDDADTRALLPAVPHDAAAREREEAARADQWREEGPWLLVALLPLAALAFRRGWLSPLTLLLGVCLAWVPPPAAQAFGWADLWWRPDQQGAQALAAGDPQQAAARFARPDWRAAAQYQAGDYDQALATLDGQAGAEADYNRGNALAHSGKLDEAVAAYERTLAEVPDHADARFNLDLVRSLLAQQAAQSQEPASSPSSGEDEAEGGENAAPRGGQEPEAGSGQAGESSPQDQGQQQNQPNQQGDQSQGNQTDQSGQQDQQDKQSQQGQHGQDGREGEQAQQAQHDSPAQQSRRGHQGGQEASQDQQDPQNQQGKDDLMVEDGRSLQEGQPKAGAGTGGARNEGEDRGGDQERQSPQEPVADQSPQEPLADQVDKPASETRSPGESAADQDGRAAQDGKAAPDPSPDQRAGAEPGVADLLGGQGADKPPSGIPPVPAPTQASQTSEAQQALEAQLRRVPDDPGGLLRQRFLLQHLRRQGQLP